MRVGTGTIESKGEADHSPTMLEIVMGVLAFSFFAWISNYALFSWLGLI